MAGSIGVPNIGFKVPQKAKSVVCSIVVSSVSNKQVDHATPCCFGGPISIESGDDCSSPDEIGVVEVMVIEFLEAMPEGLNRDQFMAELEKRVEAASGRLADEAAPHHPPVSG